MNPSLENPDHQFLIFGRNKAQTVEVSVYENLNNLRNPFNFWFVNLKKGGTDKKKVIGEGNFNIIAAS